MLKVLRVISILKFQNDNSVTKKPALNPQKKWLISDEQWPTSSN